MVTDPPDLISIDWDDGIFTVYKGGHVYDYRIDDERDFLIAMLNIDVPFEEVESRTDFEETEREQLFE